MQIIRRQMGIVGLVCLLLAACAKQRTDQATSNPLSSSPAQNSEDPGSSFHEIQLGDMIIDNLRYKRLITNNNGIQTATAKVGSTRWPGGVIPIYFDSTAKDSAFQEKVFRACEQWGRLGNIKCIRATNELRALRVDRNDPNGDGKSCSANYGAPIVMRFGMTSSRMHLPSGCEGNPTILHELGHVLGFLHEHQRADRDSYVTINKNNIDSDYLYAFDRFDRDDQITYGPYDLLSIMHYSQFYFSTNGQKTIVPKPGFEDFADLMGAQSGLSAGDGISASALYGPPNAQAVKKYHLQIDLDVFDPNGCIEVLDSATLEVLSDGRCTRSIDQYFFNGTELAIYYFGQFGNSQSWTGDCPNDPDSLAFNRTEIVMDQDRHCQFNSHYVGVTIDPNNTPQTPPNPYMQITLQTHNGNYITAESGGRREVVANRTEPGDWETWGLFDLNGGILVDGDSVALKSFYGNYMVAEDGGGGAVNANRYSQGVWETFKIHRLNGSGAIQDGDDIALESIHGFFVVAENGGGGIVNANRESIGIWETFILRAK